MNNLRYSDLLLAQGEALEKHDIQVPSVYLTRLGDWFAERVKKIERTHSLAAELKTGAKAEGGVPLLLKLFAGLTTAIRTGTSYKEEIRLAVQDAFSELADAFNALVAFVAGEVAKRGLGKTPLFVINGTDWLRRDEAETFFIHDIHQLRLVRATSSIAPPSPSSSKKQARRPRTSTPPSSSLWSSSRTRARRGPPRRAGMPARVPAQAPAPGLLRLGGDPGPSWSATPAAIHATCSGSRATACRRSTQDPSPSPWPRTAVHRLSTDYRRLVEPQDYGLLARIDAPPSHWCCGCPRKRRPVSRGRPQTSGPGRTAVLDLALAPSERMGIHHHTLAFLGEDAERLRTRRQDLRARPEPGHADGALLLEATRIHERLGAWDQAQQAAEQGLPPTVPATTSAALRSPRARSLTYWKRAVSSMRLLRCFKTNACPQYSDSARLRMSPCFRVGSPTSCRNAVSWMRPCAS